MPPIRLDKPLEGLRAELSNFVCFADDVKPTTFVMHLPHNAMQSLQMTSEDLDSPGLTAVAIGCG
jgi:hypothetical protein